MKNLIAIIISLTIYSSVAVTWLLYDSYFENRLAEVKEMCAKQTLLSELECYSANM
jgi:hypothetical protein